MKSYFIKYKEDYRFTLLLAVLCHILVFSALFLTLRHAKPLFLNASAPPPSIQAIAVDSSELPIRDPGEKQLIKKPPSKTEKAIIKPEFIEKSPISLTRKENKLAKTTVNTLPVVAKKPLKNPAPVKKTPSKQAVAKPKAVVKEKNNRHPDSAKSLQLAQKNVQQLLQQEVSTLLQKQQIAARNAATTEKYRHLILQSIAQQWIMPPKLNKHLETRLAVRLAPGGMVLEVIIVKSSGNVVLDRSAQTAVYKASPLPVPKNGLFNTFRQINLTVRPEGIIS
jgi:colicin import membrane protein